MDAIREMLAERVVELEGERDALAAHVVRLMGALELARDRITLLAEIATDKGADVYAALDMWPEEMKQTLDETPTTSLARLKAQWQAEALEEADKQVALAEHAESVRIHLRAKAANLHQQTQEPAPNGSD